LADSGPIDPAVLDRRLSRLRPASFGDGLLDALQQVLQATRQLFSASGAGLMMLDDRSVLRSVATTDEAGRLLEERQEHSGQGPCVDTVSFDRITATPDVAADHRWPQLLPDPPHSGIRAVLGIPIRFDGVVVGALNVYRDHFHDWSPSETGPLTSYGSLIEGLLRTALHVRQREALAQQLQHALDHRVVTERAVGVIMGRDRIDAVTAYNQLRDHARSTERKVADVAAELLDEVAGVKLTTLIHRAGQPAAHAAADGVLSESLYSGSGLP
jgi:GAF domain-containing protein